MMGDAVIVSAVRTPIGRANKGSLKDTRPEDLAALVVREAVRRAGVEPAEVEDVILGCAMPHGEQGMNIARIAVFLAGLPLETAGVTINRFCSSGAQAIVYAAQAIATGFAAVVVAGGVESMTRVPMRSNLQPHPGLQRDFPDAYIPMGITAENVARRYGVSREDQDAFAYASHRKAVAAWEAGRFQEHIVPVQTTVTLQYEDGTVEVQPVTLERDECLRPDTSLEKMAALQPAFVEGGTVTAGNSSPLSDGAAACLLMSRERARALGVRPLAVVRAAAVAGVHPAVMGIGPIPAVRKLFARTGLTWDDVDLVELNEAFASQALVCVRELGIPQEKLNVNGGAIALGHPLGATGARILADLVHELRRRGGRYGLETMCVGGGQGFALLVEAIYE